VVKIVVVITLLGGFINYVSEFAWRQHPWTKQMSSSAAIMEEGAGAGCSLLLDDTAEQVSLSFERNSCQLFIHLRRCM
jgi:hypothetical protein